VVIQEQVSTHNPLPGMAWQQHVSAAHNSTGLPACSLATAAGDALGAGYEFGPPLPATTPVRMVGGGGFGWAPGEWTDDTSMAIVIARIAATGTDLREPQAQNEIAQGWAQWATTAPDVGAQTSAVLSAGRGAAGTDPVTGAQPSDAARTLHEHTGRSGGNGSLMRTAPVALAYLYDEDGLVEAASALSTLTHFDPEATEACAVEPGHPPRRTHRAARRPSRAPSPPHGTERGVGATPGGRREQRAGNV